MKKKPHSKGSATAHSLDARWRNTTLCGDHISRWPRRKWEAETRTAGQRPHKATLQKNGGDVGGRWEIYEVARIPAPREVGKGGAPRAEGVVLGDAGGVGRKGLRITWVYETEETDFGKTNEKAIRPPPVD